MTWPFLQEDIMQKLTGGPLDQEVDVPGVAWWLWLSNSGKAQKSIEGDVMAVKAKQDADGAASLTIRTSLGNWIVRKQGRVVRGPAAPGPPLGPSGL